MCKKTTPTILVAGTASHVGKSTVVTGLCRRFANAGISVTPFKAQNMSNEARAVVRPAADTSAKSETNNGTDSRAQVDFEGNPPYGEIGVSQSVQAQAAGIRSVTDHNPVLLKPRGDAESQLIIDGVAVGHYTAESFYTEYWEQARSAAVTAHSRLATTHDVIIAEGAGSIAEINFHDHDLANIETARFTDARIIIVADIERGGVFASIIGTLELLPDDVRNQVVGIVITKFRGDESLLAPGIETIENRTGIPVLSVIPYDDPGLPAEDSVSLPAVGERSVRGADDNVPVDHTVTVAVPRLPRASNTADLDPLAAVPGVRVAFIPLDTSLSQADIDAVVITGTKNTVDDLRALRAAGFDDELRAFEGPIVGLCGGYQLLGERLTAIDIEETNSDKKGETKAISTSDSDDTDDSQILAGLGMLPIETQFSPKKRVAPVTWSIDGFGPLADATGLVTGYEIHAGRTTACGPVQTPFESLTASECGESEDTSANDNTKTSQNITNQRPRSPVGLGAATDSVIGTYLHGLFDNEAVCEAFVESVFTAADVERPDIDTTPRSDPYERAAHLVSSISFESILGYPLAELR